MAYKTTFHKEKEKINVKDASIIRKLYLLDCKSKERQKLVKEINMNNSKDREVADEIFSKRFKIRGIHAKVKEYSIGENLIFLIPSEPDCGVDELKLTFEQFADQVEFIE